MATASPAGNGNGTGTENAASTPARVFVLRQLYVKDISFESPNTPAVFATGAPEPDVKLNISSNNQALGNDAYEAVLTLNVHATTGDKTLFLVELQQAGLFQIAGYSADEIKLILGIHCPATLFPYAREAVSSLVGRGGFPTLLLQPINFEGLYAQAQTQARNKA